MYWKYFIDLSRHKWFVFIECARRGHIWRGIIHDTSKFLPSEFIPAAQFFDGDYGLGEDLGYKKAFVRSRLFHYSRNKHHWQYWWLPYGDGNGRAFEIPEKYMVEMLADWIGAGRAFSSDDDVLKWYVNNRNRIRLHRNNRQWIEDQIGYCGQKPEELR